MPRVKTRRHRHRKRYSKKNRRTQRLWRMKGCSKKVGGGCTDCMRGGASFVSASYPLNKLPVDLQTQTLQSRTMGQKGGGLIPDTLLNLGRSVTYGLGSAYNSLGGFQAPVNPLPYKDQMPRIYSK